MSNGSEHLDERCVHAVDGPDWAGLRELKVDPWEGFTGQSEADAADAEITDPLIRRIQELRAANEALERRAVRAELEWSETEARHSLLAAENAQLRGDLSENRRALDDAINVANGNKIARDALQARLDAVRKYAEERAWYGRASRVVGSARIASDLFAILDPVVPEGEQQ